MDPIAIIVAAVIAVIIFFTKRKNTNTDVSAKPEHITNDAVENLIKKFEGFSAKAYPDPGSKDGYPWTIGYGHTRGVKRGDIITQQQATEYLAKDIIAYEDEVKSQVKIALNQNQFDALVSFVYNIGPGQFETSTMLKLLNVGDISGAAQQFPRWNKNDGQIIKGLVRRRQAEMEWFLRG